MYPAYGTHHRLCCIRVYKSNPPRIHLNDNNGRTWKRILNYYMESGGEKKSESEIDKKLERQTRQTRSGTNKDRDRDKTERDRHIDIQTNRRTDGRKLNNFISTYTHELFFHWFISWNLNHHLLIMYCFKCIPTSRTVSFMSITTFSFTSPQIGKKR